MAMTDEEGRLRRIEYGDRIFYNSVTGIAGVIYPIGTAAMPSSVIADVITLCAAYNFHDIDVHGTLQLLAAMEHYCFLGHCHESVTDVLDLNGQDVDDSRFDNCLITGGQGGTGLVTYWDCLMYNATSIRGLLENCNFFGTIATATGGAADFIDMDGCASIHGVVTLTVASPDRLTIKDWKGNLTLTGQTGGPVFIRGFDGELEVDNMSGGTLDIYMREGEIQINADCDGGTINIYGDARVINNSAVGCTVNDYGSSGYAELSNTGATTGAAYIDALDIDARLYNEFTIKVNNTDGANSLDYRVLLRPEHGVADQMIQPVDITLAPADYDFVNIDHKWGQVIVQVRDTAAPNHATFRVYAICNKQ